MALLRWGGAAEGEGVGCSACRNGSTRLPDAVLAWHGSPPFCGGSAAARLGLSPCGVRESNTAANKARKPTTPQSNAIIRHLARKHKLYGANEEEMTKVTGRRAGLRKIITPATPPHKPPPPFSQG